MSIKARIAKARKTIVYNPREDMVSDEQLAGYLRNILDQCNVVFHFDSQAEVEIVSGNLYVLLPLDYSTASRNDLLAIEFPNAVGNFPVVNVFPSSVLPQLKRTPSTKGALPVPVITKKILNGTIRDYLVLSSSPTANATRTLNYKAKFLVEDTRWEILIKDNLSGGDVISVLVNKPDGTTVETLYTYSGNLFGSTTRAIANNLAGLINSSTNTTGVEASSNGQMVSVFGSKTELDLTVSSESTALEIDFIDAVDNTDSNISSRIDQYLEGKYKLEVANRGALPLPPPILSQLANEGLDLIKTATLGLKR